MTKRLFSKIIKRDGRKVKFESEKIIQAIEKAGQATGEFGREVAEKLAAKVLLLAKEVLKDKKTPTVEEIQDIVELVLFNSPFWKTARAYAIYREQHRQLREIVSQADVSLVDKYLEKITWEIRENSNMTFSLQGLNNYVSSKIISTYWLNKIYPEEIRKAHEEGDFHLHDLSNLSVYCVGWDLYDLLLKGFGGVPGKIESKPAKHFHSALGQLVNFLYSLQGETAGAVAVSNFDTLLAPFIYYDKLSYREVSQALQEFLFNMNVPTRVGFQTPFSNITLDLTPPPQLANSPVLIGGKLQDKTYKEFQKEIDIFNKALLENFLEGDGKGRVFSFPIPTYNITKDFDW
ncbi:ribonucleoside triphosphate reductase, partial [bacterium]|nr:ribonucleoside triphosphate reductase [bacterium]